MAHDLVTELLQYSSLACFMPIWQLCANLLIPNCLRSNLSYSPLAALEPYVKQSKTLLLSNINIVVNQYKPIMTYQMVLNIFQPIPLYITWSLISDCKSI